MAVVWMGIGIEGGGAGDFDNDFWCRCFCCCLPTCWQHGGSIQMTQTGSKP